MTWLAWRQVRLQASVVLLVVAALALSLATTAHGLRTAYQLDVTTFIDQLQFKRLDGFLYVAGLVAVHSTAPIIGAFWGAPMTARELETGTHRLAWNQSVTRTRWLATKLVVVAGIGVGAVVALSLLVTWWSRPIDRAVAAGYGSGTYSLPRMDPAVFGARGVVAVGYVLFGIAVGATVGLLLRRSIPAIAVTLVVVAAVEILSPRLLRPHLQAPVATNVVISTENLRGIQIPGGRDGRPGGPARLTVRAGGPGDWSLTNQTVDPSGRLLSTLPSWVGDCIGAHIGPPLAEGTKTASSKGRDELSQCFTQLADRGYRQHVTYQPARSFWSLQLRETAALTGLALLLMGFCFWRIRRDVS